MPSKIPKKSDAKLSDLRFVNSENRELAKEEIKVSLFAQPKQNLTTGRRPPRNQMELDLQNLEDRGIVSAGQRRKDKSGKRWDNLKEKEAQRREAEKDRSEVISSESIKNPSNAISGIGSKKLESAIPNKRR